MCVVRQSYLLTVTFFSLISRIIYENIPGESSNRRSNSKIETKNSREQQIEHRRRRRRKRQRKIRTHEIKSCILWTWSKSYWASNISMASLSPPVCEFLSLSVVCCVCHSLEILSNADNAYEKKKWFSMFLFFLSKILQMKFFSQKNKWICFFSIFSHIFATNVHLTYINM